MSDSNLDEAIATRKRPIIAKKMFVTGLFLVFAALISALMMLVRGCGAVENLVIGSGKDWSDSGSSTQWVIGRMEPFAHVSLITFWVGLGLVGLASVILCISTLTKRRRRMC